MWWAISCVESNYFLFTDHICIVHSPCSLLWLGHLVSMDRPRPSTFRPEIWVQYSHILFFQFYFAFLPLSAILFSYRTVMAPLKQAQMTIIHSLRQTWKITEGSSQPLISLVLIRSTKETWSRPKFQLKMRHFRSETRYLVVQIELSSTARQFNQYTCRRCLLCACS